MIFVPERLRSWRGTMYPRFTTRRTALLLAALAMPILIGGCDSGLSGSWSSPGSSFQKDYHNAGLQVMKRFPAVISQDDYDSYNGYIMGFRTTEISKAEAKKIADYAYPLWAQVRIRGGMNKQDAEGCAIMVCHDTEVLYPPN